MSTSKRLKALIEKVDRDKMYQVLEGINLVKETAKAKFDESVDAAINLGIDAKNQIRQLGGH
jgi:large subunit ribosomal protein L1